MNARDIIEGVLSGNMPRDHAWTCAQMILSALRAAGYAVEQDWQTMESAPRDGRRALCYAPAINDRAAAVRVDYWWAQERDWAHMRPGHPYSHWRPLPAPPASQESDDAR